MFFNRTYEKFINKQILDDRNYIVPRQQLKDYVYELIDIPFIDFIDYIKQNNKERIIETSDITQFSSFSSCEMGICKALLWANNPGCQYIDIGRLFPDFVTSATDGAYRKYGENHIKAAAQLGLAFEYYDYWYLSCLGYIYIDLKKEVRKHLLSRTILRNCFYQQMLLDIIDHDITLESYMGALSYKTRKRRVNNVCLFLCICLDECREAGIKTHEIVKETIWNSKFEIIDLSSLSVPYPNKNLQLGITEQLENDIILEEDVKRLFMLYKKGDKKAYSSLVSRHLKLVHHIAHFYKDKGVPLDDLIQEGCIGLLKAIEHFDYNKNVPFLNYATTLIIQSISLSLRTIPYIIKIPFKIFISFNKIKAYTEKFEQQFDYPPSIANIEIDENIDLEEIFYFTQLTNLKEMVFLADNMDNFEDTSCPIEEFQEKEYHKYITKNLLQCLKNRDCLIIKSFFGIGANNSGRSLTCIAERMNMSRERVRQIIVESVKTMREFLNLRGRDNINVYESANVKIGDVIYFSNRRFGRVVKIINSIKGPATFILRMRTGNLEKCVENNELYTVKKSWTEVNRLLTHYNKDRREEETKSYRNSFMNKKIKDREYRKEVNQYNGVKIGDKISYKDHLCTIEKVLLNMGGISRLIIKNENDVLDDIPNDKTIFTIISK